MTKRDAVILVSRVIGLYLLIWALDNATYLPAYTFSFAHRINDYSVVLGSSYYRSLYTIELVAAMVRVVGLLIVSAWCFHAGPRLQAFLLPPESKASS
jgi:hypothetical protein